jgi:Flp pilus assembly protein TadD
MGELRRAKKIIQTGQGTAAPALLSYADARMEAAVKLEPDNPLALGHAGYIAFLRDNRDKARSLLAEALRRGGEKVREAALAATGLHTLPVDEDFRALLARPE